MNYQKTWASKNKNFFQGIGERPTTKLEKFAIYVLAGATLLITAIRLYQHSIIWF